MRQKLKKPILILFILGVTAVFAAQAQAQVPLMDIYYQGTLDSVNDLLDIYGGAVSPGAAFSGHVAYNPGMTDNDLGNSHYGVYGPLAAFSMNLGGVHYEDSLIGSTLNVWNDYSLTTFGFRDGFRLENQWQDPNQKQITMLFKSLDGTLLSSDAPLTTLPDITDFDVQRSFYFRVTDDTGERASTFSGTVTALSDRPFTAAVPEPATLGLLGTGLLGLFFKRKS